MPSADNRITIPNFLASWPSKQGYPWEARLHAASDSIQAESEQWMRSYEGVEDSLVNKIIKGRFPDIACFVYENQTKEQCFLAALVMLHFFVIDEVTDSEDEAAVGARVAAMIQAFNQPGSHASMSTDTWVGVRMAGDITTRCKAIGTRESWRYFVDTFSEYLEGVVEEAAVRNKPVLSRADYLAIRSKTVGVLPGMALVLIECEIQPGFLELDIVRSLLDLSLLIIINQNDIYSFDKEQARGEDGHNGVRVLMEERGIGAQEAIDCLGEETSDLVRQFVHQCETLPTLKDETNNEHLRILRDGCIAWIIGMEVWYTRITTRYGMLRLDKNRAYTPTVIT